MKSLLRYLSIIIFLLGAIFANADTPKKVLIEYFFQPGCESCEKVSSFVLPQLKEEALDKYEIVKYDIGLKDNFLKLAQYQEQLKVNDNAPVSMVINRKIYLGGYDKIDKDLIAYVEKLYGTSYQYFDSNTNNQNILKQRAKKIAIIAVAIAGLIDGINPCVFSTLIFFLSLLAVSKIRGRKLLLTGITYCFACFITYFALGFGLFRFLKLFSGYKFLQNTLDIVILVVLALLAVLSFADAWKFKRSGKADSVKLQLPRSVKKTIHSVMRRGLKSYFLIPGALLIGFWVTVLESVCTGQVYVPTMVLLTKQSETASKWFGYLLLYNFMFIIPLIILFLIAYKGTSTPKFIQWSKTNVVYSKILLGLFYVCLGALLITTKSYLHF